MFRAPVIYFPQQRRSIEPAGAPELLCTASPLVTNWTQPPKLRRIFRGDQLAGGRKTLPTSWHAWR